MGKRTSLHVSRGMLHHYVTMMIRWFGHWEMLGDAHGIYLGQLMIAQLQAFLKHIPPLRPHWTHRTSTVTCTHSILKHDPRKSQPWHLLVHGQGVSRIERGMQPPTT